MALSINIGDENALLSKKKYEKFARSNPTIMAFIYLLWILAHFLRIKRVIVMTSTWLLCDPWPECKVGECALEGDTPHMFSPAIAKEDI